MDDLYEIIGEVFRNGWNLIKLYFMIGLPGYKEHDEAESIIQALTKINEIGGRRKNQCYHIAFCTETAYTV